MNAAAVPKKPGREHAAVVDYQKVTGLKLLRQIPEAEVPPGSASALKAQHPRGASVSKWLLRNEFFGKMEIEFRHQHAA
jgi:hypothetical protein